jgi:hypothetical protein
MTPLDSSAELTFAEKAPPLLDLDIRKALGGPALPTFKDLALPLAQRFGFRMIPIPRRGAKRPVWIGWPDKASNTVEGIERLQREADQDKRFSEWDAGCVADPNIHCAFDADTPTLIAQIEKETGQKIPETFEVSSGGRGCPHLYFLPTKRSTEVGNKSTGDFDFWVSAHHTVAPGSTHSSGRLYTIKRDVPLVPIPDWLCDWIAAQERKWRTETGTPDAAGYARLKKAYLENLNPEDCFGLKNLSIASGQHPTLIALMGLWHDGNRDFDTLVDLGRRFWDEYCVGREYGESTTVDGEDEIERAARHALKKDPCELTLPDNHPLITENAKLSIGMTAFANAEARAKWVAENIDALEIKAKPTEDPQKDGVWFFPAHELVNALLPPQRIFVYTAEGTPVLRASFLVELFAFRGVGKSAISMGLVKLLLKGGEFLDYRSEGGAKVLYVDGELPLCLLQERVKTFIGGTVDNLWLMSAEQLPGQVFPALIDPAVQTMFEERLEILKPDVIILDTLTACAKFDTNDTDAWRLFNSFLLRLRFKGYCVILLHHAGKNGTQRGRTDAEDNMDLVVQLTHPEGHDPADGLKACVSYTKVRYGGYLRNFACEYVGGSWRMLEDSEEKEIIELLNTGTSLRGTSTSMGVTIARVRAVKKKAKAKGLLSIPAKKLKAVKTAEEQEQEKSIREAF